MLKATLIFFSLMTLPSYAEYWSNITFREAKINPQSFAKFEKFTFQKESGIQTETLLVIVRGKILFEKYAHGFNIEKPHRVWSVTKSFVGALYGRLVQQGKISLQEKAHLYYPQIQDKSITLEHLLKMQSALDWNESYFNPWSSDVIRMLYSNDILDMADFAANSKITKTPGRKFSYKSGTSNLLMGILKKIVSNQNDYDDFPWKILFDPMGMKSVYWEQDSSKVFVGSSYLHLPARELAKFGLLYLNNGKWKGTQLLHQNWIKKSSEGVDYGFHFWLNKKSDQTLRRKSLPPSTYFASGHAGQAMAIIPKWKTIIIRLANDKNFFDWETFYDLYSRARVKK